MNLCLITTKMEEMKEDIILDPRNCLNEEEVKEPGFVYKLLGSK